MPNTATAPFPTRAARLALEQAIHKGYDALEDFNAPFRPRCGCDPYAEEMTVTQEHIAEVAIALDGLEMELTLLQQEYELLQRGLSYLVGAHDNQTARAEHDRG